MGTMKITNNSTLMDFSAIMRVGLFAKGDIYHAEYDEQGNHIVYVRRKGNGYIVTDTGR